MSKPKLKILIIIAISLASFSFANEVSATWTSGKFGSAINFDGTNDYVKSNSNLTGVSAFSHSLWFKSSDGSFSASEYLFSQGTDDPSVFIGTNGKVNVYADGVSKITSTKTFLDTNWHHLEITADGTTLKLYLDGNLESSVSYTGSSATGYFYVGSNATPGSYFGGIIDDVRIYNYARTQDEIRLDYNAGYAARFGPQSSCEEDPGSCMTKGLVGYWGMDEGTGQTAYDSSGSGNNGTLGASSAVGTDDPKWIVGSLPRGAVGGRGALQFDGVNDYVSVTDPPSLRLTTLTMSYWFKPGSWTGQNWEGSHIRKIGSAGRPYWTYGARPGEGLTFEMRGIDEVWHVLTTNKTDWNTNNFYHVVVQYNNSNGYWAIYVDGTLDNSKTEQISPSTNPGDFIIGNEAWIERFNGTIDEVRIYNRALSAEEIRYHYNRGGPVAHWKMDEGSGQKAYDDSNNNNDGWLGGTSAVESSDPTWTTGKYGSALSFDGTDDYVNTGSGASLEVNGNKTIEAWIKTSQSNNAVILGQQGGSGQWLIAIKDNKLRWDGWDTNPDPAGNTVINDGKWHHVVAVHTGGIVSLYVDGKIDMSPTSSGGSASATGNFYMGSCILVAGSSWCDASYALYPYYSNITIDSVRIYNYARTADEIRLDYNAGYAARFGPSTDCNTDPGSCMTKGLVGYWGMDEGTGQTAYDASGNSNNGILGSSASADTNDPKWTTAALPSEALGGGGALQFDGVDDYVNAGNGASLNITNAITIEAWVYPISIPSHPSFQHYIIAKLNYPNTGWWMYIGNDLYVYFNMRDGAGGGQQVGASLGSVGKWYHIVVTVVNNSDMKLYINGSIVNTRSNTVITTAVTNSLQMNSGSSATDSWALNGSIDEVRIYNRALSAEEIRYHYNRGGPVAHWKFDEGSGQKAYDDSNNNNDGTLGSTSGSDTNDPTWTAGKFGSALSFDGTDDYVNCGNGASLNITSAITIEAWVKPLSFIGTCCNAIVAKWTDASRSYRFSFDPNNAIRLTVNYDHNALTTNNVVPFNQWTHVVGVGSGAKLLIYINGVLSVTGDNYGGSITQSNQNLRIGNVADYSNRNFNGTIDEVRIYNYARSADEIKVDYNNGLAAHLR